MSLCAIGPATAAGALAGLTVESLILYPAALGIAGWYAVTPDGPALAQRWSVALAVAWSGPMTAIPLMMFATAARRMPYTVIGFLQFSSPTIVFILGLFVFGEDLRPAQLACFVEPLLRLFRVLRPLGGLEEAHLERIAFVRSAHLETGPSSAGAAPSATNSGRKCSSVGCARAPWADFER